MSEALGGLALYVNGPRGPALGGAWAFEEGCELGLHPLDGGEGGWLFGPSPAAPVAGLSPSGVVVVGLSLFPALDPVPGAVPGCEALRALLALPDLASMRASIETTALTDGRCWMLSDGEAFLGFEQLGAERILTRVGAKTSHVHANFCFDPSLRQREREPRPPTSYRRLELASTLYVQRQPDTVGAVAEFFDAVEVASFPSGEGRAEALFAVEIHSRRILWRSRADRPVSILRASPQP